VLIESFLKRCESLTYAPIDISSSILREAGLALLKDYQKLHIVAIDGVYQQGLAYVHQQFSSRTKLICFLGSSIGNFTPEDAVNFLREQVRPSMRPRDRLLIGIDLKKNKSILEEAYNDRLGITADFNLNLLERINKELNGHFDLSRFRHLSFYNEAKGRIEMHLRSEIEQKVRIDALDCSVEFRKDETIHTENSYKYSRIDIDWLAYASGFAIEKLWIDGTGSFSLALFSPPVDQQRNDHVQPVKQPVTDDRPGCPSVAAIRSELCAAWAYSDRIFDLLREENEANSNASPPTLAMYLKPIDLRHPFIFYLGHLPAFASKHILLGFVEQDADAKEIPVRDERIGIFEEIFDRGMDPNVDDPSKCHPHSGVPISWPSVQEVLSYRTQVRQHVLQKMPSILGRTDRLMAQKGRVFSMVAEHDYMVGIRRSRRS